VPSTFSLDPTSQLQIPGVSLSTTLVCPNCHQPFQAANGISFPCRYRKGDQFFFGPVIFCGELCYLMFCDPCELDKC
jgi:hypothetical protein